MYRFIKCVCDKLIALLGLIVLAPFFVLVAIIVAIDSKGKVIFKQERVGKFGKRFNIYKFRTMYSTNVDFDVNNAIINDDNANVTKIGKLLRKLKIDELPQLYNILRGDMSIIGPRPLLPIYLNYYENWEFKKLDIKPGLTGWAQVNGNGYLSIQERSFYDVYYASHQSFTLDLKIILRTIRIIFKGEMYFIKNVKKQDFDAMRVKYNQINKCLNSQHKDK